MQAVPQITANACSKINCIQYEEICPKLRRISYWVTQRLRDGAPVVERLHLCLISRGHVTPESRVRLDRIGAVPFREFFLIEREISVVAQRLDVLQIEAEPDLVIDVEIAQIRERHGTAEQ